MRIRLRQLRAFAAIVEHGSVSEAAVALGMTQSSASKLLSGFEQELGFPLFERVGRRLRLSEQGRMFYRKTGNAVEFLESIRQIAQDIRDNQGRRLRICAIGPIALSRMMPELLARFSSEHPDFSFSVEMRSRIEIEDWVASGHSDLGFTLLPADRSQLGQQPLASVRVVAAVNRSHRLAGHSWLSPERVRNAELVMPKSSVRLRGLVEAGFVQAGVNFRPRFETSNNISTVGLAAQGLGVAIVDPFTLTGARWEPLKILEWRPETVLSYGMIWPKNRSLDRHERRLFEIACEICAALRDEHPFVTEAEPPKA